MTPFTALPAVGDSREVTRVVDDALLTPQYGKPDIEVLASPAVVYLMELASIQVVEENLPDDLTSVGTGLTFAHTRPSFAGAEIVTRATVLEVNDRKVTLDVQSYEDGRQVAHADHTRAIVPRANFAVPER